MWLIIHVQWVFPCLLEWINTWVNVWTMWTLLSSANANWWRLSTCYTTSQFTYCSVTKIFRYMIFLKQMSWVKQNLFQQFELRTTGIFTGIVQNKSMKVIIWRDQKEVAWEERMDQRKALSKEKKIFGKEKWNKWRKAQGEKGHSKDVPFQFQLLSSINMRVKLLVWDGINTSLFLRMSSSPDSYVSVWLR